MRDEVFTVYKLIILYMLDRAEGDVTQAMLSSFLLHDNLIFRLRGRIAGDTFR